MPRALKAGEVDPSDLVVVGGCCCYLESCLFRWPSCCGHYLKGECCCLEAEQVCCKPAVVENECCVLWQSGCTAKNPDTLCKGVSQWCCYDLRCALPPVKEEVPCVIAYCFVVCCVNNQVRCACCKTLGDIVQEPLLQKHKSGQGKSEQQQQQQPQWQVQPSATQSKADHALSFADCYSAGEYDSDYPSPAPTQAYATASAALPVEASPYANPRRFSAVELNPMALKVAQPQPQVQQPDPQFLAMAAAQMHQQGRLFPDQQTQAPDGKISN